jgi:hypothetical protein
MTVDSKTLTDPDQLRTLRDNAMRLDRHDVVVQGIERLAELQAGTAASPVEMECWKAFAAAEEQATVKNGRTTRLSRTRQKIDRVGVVETMADLAGSPVLHQGFELLQSAGQLHLSFEYVVLKYPDIFSPAVRETARRKLIEAGISADRLPPSAP